MAALALSSCTKKADGDPFFALGECRRIELIDAGSGKAVIGAEDLAYDAAARRVLISAYDRRAVEREAKTRASEIEQGGIYAAPIDTLKGDATTLTLESVVSREAVAGGLRPHGISFDDARREVAFVNRSYQRNDGEWRMTPRIERADVEGVVSADGGGLRCSANDVAMLGDRTFVSFDHAACGWRGSLEDMFASRSSGLDTPERRDVFEGARHANGVTAIGDDRLALAATRDRALLMLAEREGGFAIERKISLPGAPDNLTMGDSGKIVAALHPSHLAIGAQRRLGFGRAGSRVVSVDPESGETTLLFDDPKGQLFSAASVAIEQEGVLVIGSALDRGIVVCKRSKAAS